MDETFYITTPIYYVNDIPHLGHAYTTVAADALARYKRLKGMEVFFLTGTDEHGQKVERSAQERGLAPIELADRVVGRFKELWHRLDISYTDFIRTTEERHRKAVTTLMETVRRRGDIYSGEYEDWYCTPCETFHTETELTGGRCPDCGQLVEKLKEPSYFFRLSRYQREMLDHIAANPEFIAPQSRLNETASFVSEGLRDLSISRTSFSWGIPVPWDNSHVVYVWFDALTNYLTGVGYPDDRDSFERFWPADVHIIGKDILRFHAVYWPSFLMAAGLPLPKKVFAHGWWTVEGQKMSKSLGNVVEPGQLIDRYGVDALRYFLLREVPFGIDGDFSHKAMVARINGDLANDLGNLVSRTLAMVERYAGGQVPEPGGGEVTAGLRRAWTDCLDRYQKAMDQLSFNQALAKIWQFIGACNKFLDQESPWKLAKEGAQRGRLMAVLYGACEALRLIGIVLFPLMPGSARKVWSQLGLEDSSLATVRLDQDSRWGGLPSGVVVTKGEPIFPRVDD